jgi:hypothetical protein
MEALPQPKFKSLLKVMDFQSLTPRSLQPAKSDCTTAACDNKALLRARKRNDLPRASPLPMPFDQAYLTKL